MKVSEINKEIMQEYLRIEEPDEQEQSLLKSIHQAAVSYAGTYTGLSVEQMDKHPDITVAVLALMSDMYDNRAIQTKETGTNRIVESILAMHSENLL